MSEQEFRAMSTNVAARIAGVSRTTLLRWMDEGMVSFRDPRRHDATLDKTKPKINPRKIVYRFDMQELEELRLSTKGERMAKRRQTQLVYSDPHVPSEGFERRTHPSTNDGPRIPGETHRQMTLQAAARYVDVSTSSIWRWIRDGVLTDDDAMADKKGRRTFDLDALEAVAEKSKNGFLKLGRTRRERIRKRYEEAGLELDDFRKKTPVLSQDQIEDISKWRRVFKATAAWKEAVEEFGENDVTTRQLRKFLDSILMEP